MLYHQRFLAFFMNLIYTAFYTSILKVRYIKDLMAFEEGCLIGFNE